MTMHMRRALVTGADGFLGRHLVRELEVHGIQVTRLSRQAGPGLHAVAMGDAPWQTERLAAIIRQAEPDAVFHLAGSVIGSAADLQILNVDLANAVMQAISLAEARPVFLCCGSAAEYGNAVREAIPTPEAVPCAPATAYGASKLAQTRAALAFGAASASRVVVARIFNPIGPSMPSHLALGSFARHIAALPPHGGVLPTGRLDVARDFIDVALVARALRLLAQQSDAHGVINICSGKATWLAQLVDMLIGFSGKPVRPVLDPTRLRAGEMRASCGDPRLLWGLIGRLPDTDYPDVMRLLWQAMDTRVVEKQPWSA